jgi:hypothetical protein
MSGSNDDMKQVEDECRLVGGPFDGETVSLPRRQSEYVLPVEAASLFAELGEILGDLNQLADNLEGLPSDGEILDESESDPDEGGEEYAQPAPGGVLYRRGDDGFTLHFVGHISVEELERGKDNEADGP